MRKIIIISNVWLMALLLIISMTGCGTDVASSAATAAIINNPGTTCSGAACVPLATAGNFTILAESTITNVSTSSVVGNVGLSPAAASFILLPCAEMTGTIYGVDASYPTSPTCFKGGAADKTLVDQAVADRLAAYNHGASHGEFPQSSPDATYLDLLGGTIAAGTVLPAGVYDWGTAVSITGNITLTGSATDVWIFRITGTLGMNSNMKITLGGAAQASNIFWIVAGVVTIDTGAEFKGVVLSPSDIQMLTGSKINGRLLSQTQVVLQMATVTAP